MATNSKEADEKVQNDDGTAIYLKYADGKAPAQKQHQQRHRRLHPR